MSVDLRKKLKPSPVGAMKEQDAVLEAAMGTQRTRNGQLKLDPGNNTIRIYPAHENTYKGATCTFAEAKVIAYIPGMVTERDKDGNEVKDENGKPKMKVGRRPVYNSRIHGKRTSNGQITGIDLIDEYISIARRKAYELYENDEEARKKFMLPIYGFFSRDASKKVDGITYTEKWEIYADKHYPDGRIEFGVLEIGKLVKTALNSIATLETKDDPMGTDPFTDPDEGRAVIITYNDKAEKAADYYSAGLDPSTETVTLEGGRTGKVQKVYPLTDDQLVEFFKRDPLAKMYREVFTRKDLELQITGLSMLEEKNPHLDIFKTAEFDNLINSQLAIYPVQDDEEQPEGTSNETISSPEEENASQDNDVMNFEAPESVEETPSNEPEGSDLPFDDEFESMTRAELKTFCSDNETGIVITPQVSDFEIRNKIRTWKRAQEVATPVVEEKPAAVENKATVSDKPLTAKEKMEAAREKKKAEEGK